MAANEKLQRQYLREYTDAMRHMEVSQVAIAALEPLHSREAMQAVRVLKRGQQRQLKLADAAAAKLGAPYGA